MSDYAPELIQKGHWLFAGEAQFIAGSTRPDNIPEMADLPAFAFVGRSNVGKSSLLNALTNRKKLARTSNTPGATRQINFFQLREHLMLVDLPGYGYAKRSKSERKDWNKLITYYLKSDPNLLRVFILIDARRGFKPDDEELMHLLDDYGMTYQVVLTKCDKAKQQDIKDIEAKHQQLLQQHGAMVASLFATSAEKKTNIEGLRADIAQLIANRGM